MKIKKSLLLKLVKEELVKHIGALLEADKPGVIDANAEAKAKAKAAAAAAAKKAGAEDEDEDEAKKAKAGAKAGADNADQKPRSGAPNNIAKGGELELGDDPADDPLAADGASDKEGEDEEGKDKEGEEAAEIDISEAITGKVVQSITMEPRSKILPGAQEVVLTFEGLPDPLRILLLKSGHMAFYYRSLRNEL